ncbi:xylulokinase [Subtercola boreus]|uniref:Xylulose kinase n=1 Tax=Subtercola boreus TaxID=120213 RepID=A0A3E0WFJ3_9MICO|nr:FGGY family carbohydrate kinase [Subtercola boreus]RFA22496.1 xylulose kinase [Subtercola boreus]RFA23266.1 xylulose kinase [Subtercola boreus]RFA29074.1 xylulose kinase [Subtercola boreus]
MTLVAGVDSSTQSCKIVIRDAATGALVRSGRAAHPEGTSVDPEAWWGALQTAIADAGGLDDVAAISISGQQHGMVVLDAAGAVIRDALLWNDTRSAPAAAALLEEVGAAALAERVGSLPVASFTATKLRWLRDAEPANAARVAAVALPHDWLTWRLLGYGPAADVGEGPGSGPSGVDPAAGPLGTDLDALVTDRSDASGTSYWSPARNAYDLDLFELAFGRPAVEAQGARGGGDATTTPGASAPVILPRVLEAGATAGTTVAITAAGIPAGIRVGPGAGDNAGAALGLDATAGDIVVSIGTSGTAFGVTDHPVADLTGTVAGFADAAGTYLPLVATLNAARVLTSISTLLGVDYDEFARLALAAEPGAGGVVLVPYFEGERTPNLPDATATLAGLTLGSASRQNFARAAIEGMLCALSDGVDAVRALGVDARRILLIGGAAQNPALQAVAAQVFDVAVSIPTPGEYVADGAARQAAWTLTGTRPTWPLSFAAELAADTVPAITAQYRRAQSLGSIPRP